MTKEEEKQVLDHLAALERRVQALERQTKVEFFPGGEVKTRDLMCYCPTGIRTFDLREVVEKMIVKMGLRLHVKAAEAEMISFK